MKQLQQSSRSSVSGQGLVIVIIFLAVIGGGLYWLYSHKQAMDKEGRAFGKQMIQKLTVEHDLSFFTNNLSPQARLDYPPSQQQYMIGKFTEMGVPAEPIAIDENMTWESHFFEPKGYFTAHLKYPAQGATLEIAISHPVSKWQLDNLTMTWDRQR